MTRRPRKSRPARKMPRKPRRAIKPIRPDPLDDFIVAGAHALELKLAKGWLPAVRTHLQVTLRLGALVADFELADDAEPAPVFEA